MKLMLVRQKKSAEFTIISIDNNHWYRTDQLISEINSASVIELLAYHADNPEFFNEAINRQSHKLEIIDLASCEAELPFQPLSYRDFMLYEEHYIEAKRGFVSKYIPNLLPLINIYERVANKTFPKLKPEKRWYEYPIYYLGNHLTFIKNGSAVDIPPYSKELDYELELGVVISKPLYNATAEEAQEAMGGFVVFNDFSARDVQADEMKCGFGPMKSKNFANSISSVVVSADKILPIIDKLKVQVYINDELIMQNTTSNMYYSLAEAIAYASWQEQLYPGEFFGSGTIPGCTGIENGQMLNSGDIIRLEIIEIGKLENTVN
ncbi:MAG: fumarylacetoacetate hydrolase family protein [Gammaproteobacteria bacterium]|nr:fumarylacetoacetate hydrolase family protein [Gammaproteobacteria bacterium]